jgi:cysteine-rich repeat protein
VKFLVPLLLAVGCTPAEQLIELSEDDPIWEGALPVGQAPPPFEMSLEAGNFVQDEFGRVTATGLPPNTDVRVVWSTLLGQGPCPKPLGERCLSIQGPVRVSPITLFSADGEASFGMRIPRGGAGTTIAIQLGVTGDDPQVSNPVIRLVAPPLTAVAGDVDGDGDGFTPDDGDCADFDAAYRPDANDVLGDGLDLNCDNFDGTDGDGDGCEDSTGCSPWCGDGRVGGPETCDDDNRADGDGCSAVCEVEPNTVCDTSEPSVCDVDECAAAPCFSGVTCSDIDPPGTGFVCGTCPSGYEGNGISCSNIDGCAPSPCFSGVSCSDVPPPGTGATCGACPTGYSGNGITCTDTNECSPNPCFSGVTCTDVAAPGTGFSCGSCPAGYTGNGVTCTAIPTFSTCKAILDAGLSTGSGIYALDPDGAGGVAAYNAYCDMVTDGGGWTLLAHWSSGPTVNITYDQIAVTGRAMTTFSANTATYPVFKNGSTNNFTQQLFKSAHPTWTSIYGAWVRYNVLAQGTVITSAGIPAVKANGAAVTLYGAEGGWAANTPMSGIWSLMTQWGNGGPCGGANQCASGVCPHLENSNYPCHWDWSSQKFLFGR